MSAWRGRSGRAVRRALAIGALLAAGGAAAQTDEIQVYTGEIEEPGAVGLTLHLNATPSGRRTPRFPGGVVPDGAVNGVPELAVGVAPWAELGLYLPLFTVTRDGDWLLDGAKLRALFVIPDAGRRRVYGGVNVELSWNARRWDPSRVTGEARYIAGGRLGPVELTVNPILDTAFDGVGAISLAPAERLAWHLSDRWAVAVEHYASLGALDRIARASQQEHALFAVVDRDGAPASVELGVGFGLTGASDALVLKLIVSPDP